MAADARSLAAQCEMVFMMLADDGALEEITFGEKGLISSLAPRALHVSMSTISPALARRLAGAHAARGQAFISCPVSGRPVGLKDGRRSRA